MALTDQLIQRGNFLFRHRSYLPISLFLLYAVGLLFESEHVLLISSCEWKVGCFSICMTGLIIRVITVGKVAVRTSGRNTKTQRADILNQTGIYSMVRHPLYLGNYFMWAGMFLLLASAWIFIVFSLIYWLYYERIMLAEEDFLRNKFGQEFKTWSGSIPAFIPSIKNYKKSTKPFSLKMVIRREYTTLSAMVLLFVLLNILNNGVIHQSWNISARVMNVLFGTGIFYLGLRTLKKLGKL